MLARVLRLVSRLHVSRSYVYTAWILRPRVHKQPHLYSIVKKIHSTFAMWSHKCTLADDRKFGPGVQCRDFDFTLLFEQLILGIVVSSIFSLLVLFRVKKVFGEDAKSISSWLQKCKTVRVKNLFLHCMHCWPRFRHSRYLMLYCNSRPWSSGLKHPWRYYQSLEHPWV
jgi:hypothetical protein